MMARSTSADVSSPALLMGSEYDVYLGGNSTGVAGDGSYTGGTYTPGSEYIRFTVNSVVTMSSGGPALGAGRAPSES